MNDLGDLRAIGLTNAHAQMLMKDAKAPHAQLMRNHRPHPLTLRPRLQIQTN